MKSINYRSSKMKRFIFLMFPLISYSLLIQSNYSQINLNNAHLTVKGNLHTNLNIYGNGSIKINDSKFKAGVIDCGVKLFYTDKEKVKYFKKRNCFGFKYKYYSLLGQYLGNGEFSKGSYSKFPNTLKHKYVVVVFDNGYTKKLLICGSCP